METIKRRVFVLRDTIKDAIDYSLGTDMVPIEYHIMDFNIPATAAAVVYVLKSDGKLDKILADVLDNVISFRPEKGFFAEGLNAIQIRIVDDNKALVSFTETVRAGKNIKFDDDTEAQQKTLIEQLLTKIGEFNVDVKNERAERKKEIDVERQRINNLTKLQEGSTTGDAELADIRVGVDGKTYSNAGEAVRGQIGELKSDKVSKADIPHNVSKQLLEMVEKTKVDNTWNEDYGNYFDKGNGNLIEYDQMCMCSLQVNEGDIYDIKSRAMYRMSLWSMHDSEGNVVKWWNDGNMSLPVQYVVDNGVVIPLGVTELRVYAYVGHLSGYVNKYCLKIKEDSPLKGMTWCPIGDSITDETTLSDRKNYVDYVSEITGLKVVKNCGIGGTGYLADNNGTSKCFYNRIISADDDAVPTGADIYTIFGSFNDMGKFTDDMIGTIESTDPSTLIGAMVKAIYAIEYKNPDAIVAVIFPTPWSSYNNTTIAKRTTTEKYINALRESCEKYSIPYLDLYHKSGLRPWDINFNKKYYVDDNGDGNYTEGVHPNSLGHEKFIAPKILKFMESLTN